MRKIILLAVFVFGFSCVLNAHRGMGVYPVDYDGTLRVWISSPTDPQGYRGWGIYPVEYDGTLRTWDEITPSSPTFDTVIINRSLILGDIPAQNLTAISTILSEDSFYNISSTSDIVMTSTPTIADGAEGHWLVLTNTGTYYIDIQDDAVLPGSNVFYGGSNAIIAPKDSISLLFDPAMGGWIIQSHPNLQVAGANADIIPVRNTSGTTIPALSAVYASGYNVGQHRILIALADADDSATMPAIGITRDSIPDGANGVVIISGIIEANLSAYSLYDTLYASTTAGGLTNARPIVDEIQALAIVTRAHAQGSLIVIGAGRTNDVPVNFTANSVTVTVMGISRIDWADGTVQVSSPTVAAAAVNYQRFALYSGWKMSPIFNSSDTINTFGSWFDVIGTSGTIIAFHVSVASTTTDAVTIRVWRNGSSTTTLSMAAGDSYQKFVVAIDCDEATIIGIDFEDVDPADPAGGFSVVAILEED